MNSAYLYAKKFGFEVDVIYPHERFHEFKSYAHNFPYINESPEDIENIDEINIDSLEKKLSVS